MVLACSQLGIVAKQTNKQKKTKKKTGFFFRENFLSLFKTFYFALGYSQLANNAVIVSDEQRRD